MTKDTFVKRSAVELFFARYAQRLSVLAKNGMRENFTNDEMIAYHGEVLSLITDYEKYDDVPDRVKFLYDEKTGKLKDLRDVTLLSLKEFDVTFNSGKPLFSTDARNKYARMFMGYTGAGVDGEKSAGSGWFVLPVSMYDDRFGKDRKATGLFDYYQIKSSFADLNGDVDKNYLVRPLTRDQAYAVGKANVSVFGMPDVFPDTKVKLNVNTAAKTNAGASVSAPGNATASTSNINNKVDTGSPAPVKPRGNAGKGSNQNSNLSDNALDQIAELCGASDVKAVKHLFSDEFNKSRYAPTPAMVEKAKTILTYLRDNGYTYNLKAGRHEGQLELSVPDARLNIRLLEPNRDDLPSYIGKIHTYSGLDFRLRVMVESNGIPKKDADRKLSYLITNEHMEMLLDYALGRKTGMGESQPRNGYFSKTNAENKSVIEDGMSKNSSYTVSLGRPFKGNVPPGVCLGVYVVQDYNSGYPFEYDPNNPKSAFDWLRNTLAQAKVNYINSVDYERIIRSYCNGMDEERDSGADMIAENNFDESMIRTDDSSPKEEAVLNLTADILNENNVYGMAQAMVNGESYNSENDLEYSEISEIMAKSYRALELDGLTDDPKELQRALVATTLKVYIDRELDSYLDYAAFGEDERIGMGSIPEDGLTNKSDVCIDPVFVADYAKAGRSSTRTKNYILDAMRLCGFGPENVAGNSFFKDSAADALISYRDMDEAGNHVSRTLAEVKKSKVYEDKFFAKCMTTVKETLENLGMPGIIDDSDISMDDQGIIKYTLTRTVGQNNEFSIPVTGYIGQVFAPDERGIVTTDYASTPNYKFAPRMEGHVEAKKGADDTRNPYERVRVRDYDTVIQNAIRSQVTASCLGVANKSSGKVNLIDPAWINTVPKSEQDVIKQSNFTYPIGSPVGLNNQYKHLQGMRYPLDYFDDVQNWAERITSDGPVVNKEKAVKFRYDLADKQTHTVYLQEADAANCITAKGHELGLDKTNPDNKYSIAENCDWIDMSAPDYKLLAGRFDHSDTGSSSGQGKQLVMVSSATVDEKGYIVPGDVQDSGTLTKSEICAYKEFDAQDRKQMFLSQLNKALAVVEKASTAHMAFYGWEMEDGYVISKKFAEAMGLMGKEDGKPLEKGDKISDFHGNKGVVNLVVDPDMPLEEARKLGIEKEVAWFKANPDMDVIGSPLSFQSRATGGSVREMMENPRPINVPEGIDLPEGVDAAKLGLTTIGDCGYVLTDMTAEHKTNMYYLENERNKEKNLNNNLKKGRNVSSQLLWVLSAHGCDGIIKEIFGNNTDATKFLREHLIAVGLDMSQKGNLLTEYTPFDIPDMNGDIVKEQRNVFEVAPLPLKENGEPQRLNVNNRHDMMMKFMNEIERKGGFLKLPFPLSYKGLLDGERRSLTKNEDGTFNFPILAAEYRSSTTIVDGAAINHDYTEKYASIYNLALEYNSFNAEKIYWDGNVIKGITDKVVKNAKIPVPYEKLPEKQKQIVDSNKAAGRNITFYYSLSTPSKASDTKISIYDSGLNLSDDEKFNIVKQAKKTALTKMVAAAQRTFDGIQSDIIERQFSGGKRNVCKDRIMNKAVKYSATSIATGDPRLDLGTLAMSTEMAENLNMLKKDKAGNLMRTDGEGNFYSKNKKGFIICVDENGKRIKSGESQKALVHKYEASQVIIREDRGVLCWRDPEIDLGGVRSFDIKLDDSLTGIAMNPVVAESFGGDFDGDTYGLTSVSSKDALKDCYDKLKPSRNLLNFATGRNKEGRYPLYFNTGGDVAVGCANDPVFKKRLEEIEIEANKIYDDLNQRHGVLTPDLEVRMDDCFEKLSTCIKESLSSAVGCGMNYSSPEKIVECVQDQINMGAKGKNAKEVDGKYTSRPIEAFEQLGFETKCDDDGRFISEETVDTGKSLYDKGHDSAVSKATGTKNAVTGVAGKFSQYATAAFRDFVGKLGLIGAQVTQAVLDVKRDPLRADIITELLIQKAKWVWEGIKVDENGAPVTVKNNQGRKTYVHYNDPKEWIKDFMHLMTDKNQFGVDINKNDVEDVAQLLTAKTAVTGIYGETIPAGSVMGTKAFALNFGAVIDRLAYDPASKKFNTWIEAAARNENLYASKDPKTGEYQYRKSVLMAPASIYNALTGNTDKTSLGGVELIPSSVKIPEKAMEIADKELELTESLAREVSPEAGDVEAQGEDKSEAKPDDDIIKKAIDRESARQQILNNVPDDVSIVGMGQVIDPEDTSYDYDGSSSSEADMPESDVPGVTDYDNGIEIDPEEIEAALAELDDSGEFDNILSMVSDAGDAGLQLPNGMSIESFVVDEDDFNSTNPYDDGMG